MYTLNCVTCGREHPADYRDWRCSCGGRLELRGSFSLSRDDILAGEHSLWRYRRVLPVSPEQQICLGEGWTPLVRRSVGGREVLLKLDHLFPSGSYKDRGAAVLLSKVRELGLRRVVEDSSGNAGAAVAAYAAAAGITADIYVPASNSPGKLAQIRSCGARLVPVEGSRSDTAAAALRAAEEHYYASHVWNPFFLEGTKTFAYELWEQLGFRAPDAAVLPAGNGTLLLGAYRGFSELLAAGCIDRLPRLIAVQSAACAPLAARLAGRDTAAEDAGWSGGKGTTLAEGIAITEPPLLEEMARAVAATGGEVVTVEEGEIRRALGEAVRSGLYIEPTAAASLAGLSTYAARAPEGETIAGVVTGHGLKAAQKIADLLEEEQ
jgi:threonine synthase